MTVYDDDHKPQDPHADADGPGASAGAVGQQRLVAAAVAIGLAAMGALFLAGGGWGGLVPHDASPRRTTGFRIDLNTASRAELMQLPGIGPQTADRILAAREANGPFDSIDALADIPGIGEVTLGRIRGFLRPPKSRASQGPSARPTETAPDVRTGEPVSAGR